MVMSHIEEVEIVNTINFLNNSSPGWDGIPSLLAKTVIHSYIRPFTLLINLSKKGFFPD